MTFMVLKNDKLMWEARYSFLKVSSGMTGSGIHVTRCLITIMCNCYHWNCIVQNDTKYYLKHITKFSMLVVFICYSQCHLILKPFLTIGKIGNR